MSGIVIVRTGGEIGIKSKPVRRAYEGLVLKSIKARLRASYIPFSRIWRMAGRVYVECEEADVAALELSRLFGVSSTSPGESVPSDLKTMVEEGVSLARRILGPGTFAVRCRRVGSHDYSSQDVCRAMGEAILSSGIRLEVDLDKPDQVISVEIRDKMAILYAVSHKGPDGFPLGSQSPVIGIIDSTPESMLASWCIMKRGSDLSAVVPGQERDGQVLDPAIEGNLRLLAAWKPSGSIRVTVVDLPGGMSGGEMAALLLSAAAGIARRSAAEAVVSGLSPNLDSMKELMALHTPVIFPLAAMDPNLARAWASMVGVKASALSYPASCLDLRPVLRTDNLLESSRVMTIRA